MKSIKISLKLIRGDGVLKDRLFVGYHLCENLTLGKSYDILDSWSHSKLIEDDSGKLIWISKNCQRAYFKLIKENIS